MCVDFNLVQIFCVFEIWEIDLGEGAEKYGDSLGTKRVSRVVECVCVGLICCAIYLILSCLSSLATFPLSGAMFLLRRSFF